MEGRTGEVVQDDGKGKLVVNLHPDRIGGDPVKVRVPLSKLVCKPGGRKFLGKLLQESALASSAVTVDEKDADVYPFGRYDVGEAAETPPPTTAPEKQKVGRRVTELLTRDKASTDEIAEEAQKQLVTAIEAKNNLVGAGYRHRRVGSGAAVSRSRSAKKGSPAGVRRHSRTGR